MASATNSNDMKRIILFFIMISSVYHLFGQNFTVSGLITDYESGNYLVKAECFDKFSNTGTVTGNNGKYSLELQRGKHVIIYKSLGYQTLKKTIFVSKDTIVNVQLKTNFNQLEQVVVNGKIKNKKEVTRIDITPQTIQKIPSFIGQKDLMKAISFLPGIDSGKEGFSNLYVRGADRGQNAIYYDGILLTNTNHVGGFFSIFDTDFLQDIKIYKDYIPGKFGGGLSSVIDIKTKNKQPEKLKVHADIGLLLSKIFAEIPVNHKMSMFLSARTSYYDLFERKNKKIYKKTGRGNYMNYQVYDINTKFNYKFSDKNNLSFSVYFSKDNQYSVLSDRESKSENTMKINNLGLSLKQDHRFNNRLSLYSKLAFSKYNFYSHDLQKDNYLSFIDKFNYKVKKYNFQSYLDFNFSSSYNIETGIEITKSDYTPVNYNHIATDNQSTRTGHFFDINSTLNPIEASFFIDNNYKFNKKINLHLDFRNTLYHTAQRNYFRIEPRFVANWQILPKLMFSSGFTITNQFNHVFVNNNDGFDWVFRIPSSEIYKPQHAFQTFVKFQKTDKHWDMSLGGYYKKMFNLLFFHTGIKLNTLTSSLSNDINSGGIGKSYGIELQLSGNFNKFSTGLSYTLSHSVRHFYNLNYNLDFPSTYDRLHNLDFNLSYKISKFYTAGFHFVLKSGAYTTFPVAYVQGDNLFNGHFIYGKINNQRLPLYHRLDFSLIRTKINKNGKKNAVSLNIYNVYNRSNAVYIYYDYETHKVKQKSLFPIIPTINISFDF